MSFLALELSVLLLEKRLVPSKTFEAVIFIIVFSLVLFSVVTSFCMHMCVLDWFDIRNGVYTKVSVV